MFRDCFAKLYKFALCGNLLMISFSCNKKVIIDFHLKVITFEAIGGLENDKFPSYFINLCNPIDIQNSSKIAVCPFPVEIHRIGLGNEVVKIDIPYSAKSSDINNINYRKNISKKYFQDNSIGHILSVVHRSEINKDSLVNEFLYTLGKNDKVFYYCEKPKIDSFKNELLYSNVDTLRLSIASALSKKPKLNVIVVLNPVSESLKETGAIKKIYGRTTESIKASDEYSSILKIAEEYAKTTFDETDHEFEHPELFNILTKAGISAIEGKKSAEMIEKLNNFKEQNLPFFKKVYPGHENRWDLIYDLIKTNDIGSLKIIREKLDSAIIEVKKSRINQVF